MSREQNIELAGRGYEAWSKGNMAVTDRGARSIADPFHVYVSGLARNLHEGASGEAGFERSPSDFERAVRAVHLYPWVVVIEKRLSPLTELRAPRRGTEWQVVKEG